MRLTARYANGRTRVVRLHRDYKWRDVNDSVEQVLHDRADIMLLVDINDLERRVLFTGLTMLALDSADPA